MDPDSLPLTVSTVKILRTKEIAVPKTLKVIELKKQLLESHHDKQVLLNIFFKFD